MRAFGHVWQQAKEGTEGSAEALVGVDSFRSVCQGERGQGSTYCMIKEEESLLPASVP